MTPCPRRVLAARARVRIEPPPAGFDSWDSWADERQVPVDERERYCAIVDPDGRRPRVLFQEVPEGTSAKNRVHLDVHVGSGRDVPAEERGRRRDEHARALIARGATEVTRHDEWGMAWVVMRDPEGNEFCVA